MRARGNLGREDFGLADLLNACDQERIARQELAHAEAPRAAGDQMMVAVGRGDVAQDLGDGADLVQMLRRGRGDRSVLLQQHADRPVGLGSLLRAGDAVIDLVIADVEMPRMDGFGLLQAIRADARLAPMPVILMTSRADPEDVRRGLDLGASAYITKQKFDQRDLLATIGQLL